MVIHQSHLKISLIPVDPSAEIRIRSLREFTLVLKNNFLFAKRDSKGSSEDLRSDHSVVSLDVLVRHLIRWFQFRPVSHEAEVLDLLALIFSVSLTNNDANFNQFLSFVAKGLPQTCCQVHKRITVEERIH